MRKWKQSKCSPIGDWLNKLWYMHRMEYDILIKVCFKKILDTEKCSPYYYSI